MDENKTKSQPSALTKEISSSSTLKPESEPEQKQTTSSKRPDPSFSWGVTPSAEATMTREVDKDHPVHKIPLEKQEKMRKKGINPVLKAEMDEKMKGAGGFWTRVGMTAMGGGWIK